MPARQVAESTLSYFDGHSVVVRFVLSDRGKLNKSFVFQPRAWELISMVLVARTDTGAGRRRSGFDAV